MSVINVVDLKKTYKAGRFSNEQVEALKGISLQIEEGEVFGILGPNGAGKTTLIKILMGLIRPSSGRAEILNQPIGQQALRRRLGYLPEHHRFPGYLTGHQALDYYGRLAGMSGSEIRAREGEVLDRVGMKEWANTQIRNYSKGMSQRLGLAQAMIHDPEIYFLDEPTDGVDPVGRIEIREVLKALADKKKTVFINSHLLQEVELVCERVAIVTQGEILKTGTMKEITERRPQVHLVVSQSCEAIRSKITSIMGADYGREAIDPTGNGKEVKITLNADDNGKVDQVVDLIRNEKYSLRAMERVRLTLEEAFLEAVGETRQVGGSKVKAKILKAKVLKAKSRGKES
jgi:ABC-2 type transport system ATP-binding protein